MLKTIWLSMVITGSFLFILSVVLVFVFRIPDLLDELSGRKAKRQIKRLKELNIGTGALGDMATDDIYTALPTSGTLLEEQIVKPVENKEEKRVVSYSTLGEDDDTSDVTADAEEDDKTGLIEEPVDSPEGSTSFIDEKELDESGTTCIEEEIETGNEVSEVSEVLRDIRDYCSNKQVIEVLEEQTSL